MTRRIVRPQPHQPEPDFDLPPGVIDGHAPVMLHRSVRLLEEAAQYRMTAVRFARDAGMTFQAIGDLLGLSEARVRQILAAEIPPVISTFDRIGAASENAQTLSRPNPEIKSQLIGGL